MANQRVSERTRGCEMSAMLHGEEFIAPGFIVAKPDPVGACEAARVPGQLLDRDAVTLLRCEINNLLR